MVDTFTFGFALNATNFSSTAVQSNLSTATGANSPSSASSSGCSISCPLGLADFYCYLEHFGKCWSTLVKFLLIMLAIGAAGGPGWPCS